MQPSDIAMALGKQVPCAKAACTHGTCIVCTYTCLESSRLWMLVRMLQSRFTCPVQPGPRSATALQAHATLAFANIPRRAITSVQSSQCFDVAQPCNQVNYSAGSRCTLLVAHCLCNAQASTSSSLPPQLQEPRSDEEHCIVNFYHLVDLEGAEQVAEVHRRWILSKQYDLRGRIYISPQGVNAQYGGTVKEATAYAKWVESQPGFSGLRFTVWPATDHSFPKLRLKYKPNLISLAGGMQALPITDPSQRATPLEPADWKRMIVEAQSREIVVLDVRNDYEWDAGHFTGAERPAEEIFAETPVGEQNDDLPQALQGRDPDAPVMMYCTGGIRCDVYSAFLRRKGYNNLYTLHGGVQNYLRQEGADHWKGSLFVFDGRMAIPAASSSEADGSALPAAVPCQVCGSPQSQLPHMNCANIDCNELFVACSGCKTRYDGCCCEACMSAPRLLRPAKVEGGQYGSWGNYAEGDEVAPLISLGRREGRAARRARRREALKDKRMSTISDKLARKNMMREAMAQIEAAEAAAQNQAHTQSQMQAQQPEGSAFAKETVAAA